MRLRLRSIALFGFFGVVAAFPAACGGGGGERPNAILGIVEGGTNETGSTGPADSGADVQYGTPANIEWTSTICGTTACGIMGVRKSGFQELADVSFTVKDSEGIAVPGVDVVFELESPPTGTEFLSGNAGVPSVTIKTDAKGIASARVQSGITLGVFTVKATVGADLLARSPAIGVRGATPANRGFTLQCEKKNLAAYIDPSPPRPMKTNCTATLVDRFNNPVGKPTTINFKVEAGAIASSVQSKSFDPMGNNADEGKATVEFNTVGAFPANNVAPLLTPGTYSTGVESSDDNPAADGVNQRDGLVTLIAYAAGEEAFDDNNSNGQWDPGENFIDQGEPFVDANDNNQWDIGETYADVAPADGKYNPPNGVWDKATTIWTVAYVLYTGEMTYFSVDKPNLHVPAGGNDVLRAYFSDARWNRPQNGATTFEFARTGTRGTATPIYDGVLDGFGFAITRALFDATNHNVGCSASIARCEWLTKFAFTTPDATWLGITVNLAGGQAGGSTEVQTFTFKSVVHGNIYQNTSTVYMD